MAIKYLLDTNILSEPVRKTPNYRVVARLQEATETIAMAATTWHELLFGVHRMPASRRHTALKNYLLHTVQPQISILPYDAQAATWFAQERARLTANGRPPSYPDGQIAAVAVTNDLILVTRNVADFIDFSGLKMESWFA